MLQQTQVDRVLPKYAEWLDKYPSFDALAAAPEHDVTADVVSARLQHPAAAPADDRARGGARVRRPAADRRGDAALVQGHRRLHGRRHSQLRVRQRAAILDTNVARVLFRVFVGKGDPKSHAMKRHLWALSATLVPHAPRLRFQPGADGFRRDGLRRAQPEVPRLPDGEELPRVSRSTPDAREHDDDRRRRRRHRTRRPISRHAAPARHAPRGLLGVSRRQVRGRRRPSRRAWRASCARSSASTRGRRRSCSRRPTTTRIARSSCTSCAARSRASRRRSSDRRCGGSRATSSRRSNSRRPTPS